MLITDALTLDTKAQASVQTFSFFYKVTSNGTGTPNFSGTSSNAIGVAIYDVTNSAWIQPAGVFNLVQSSGVGKSSGTFQVPSNCTSVRLAVYFPNSTAASGGSPFTVVFDDFVLGPQNVGLGSIPKASTFQTFTTGSGTYTTPTNPAPYMIRVRMVGGGGGGAGAGTAGGSAGGPGGATTFSVLTANGGSGGATAGGAGGAGGTGSLGSGPIGTALIGGSGFGAPTSGLGNAYSSGGAGAGTPFGGGGNPGTTGGAGGAGKANTGGGGGGGGMSVTSGGNGGAGGGAGGFVDAIITNPATSYSYSVGTVGTAGTAGTSGTAGGAGASGYIEVEELYIAQNVLMSNDTDTRVVAMSASGVGGAVTANVTNIPTTTTTLDTHASWSGSVYTVPVSGSYQLFGSGAGPSNASFFAYIDGVSTYEVKVANGTNASGAISYVLPNLRAGQTISIRSNVSQTLTNFALAITRISGPATIAASETIAASAGSSAGNSIANATLTFIDFPTATINTHGAITGAGSGNNTTYTSTWRFIAPISGTYLVSANITVVQSAATTTSLDTLCIIAKNGVGLLNGQRQNLASTVASAGYGSNVSGLIKANAGDAISIIGYQSNPGSTARNMEANSQANFVSIVRVGN
jgi:hypothetical protein